MILDNINSIIKAAKTKKIVIWGAGEHTERLIKDTEVGKLNIVNIVDKNKAGQILCDYNIKSPKELDFKKTDAIIISSFTYQDEIENEIRSKYAFDGTIFKIYNSEDKEPFYCSKEYYLKIQDEYINRIKKYKLNKKKIRIMFVVTQNQLWNCQSFYDELATHDPFDVSILAMPNNEDNVYDKYKSCLDNYNFFKKRNMNVIIGYDVEKNEYKSLLDAECDIMFFDQPYNEFLNLYPYEELSKKFFLCYIPYGYKVALQPQAHCNMKLQNISWRVFVESEWHYKQFKKYQKINAANVIVSGYPKLDIYNDHNKPDYSLWKNKMCNKKRIIWAPHWTINNTVLSFSTFHSNYKQFFEYAKKHTEIDWIFKPHQRLYYWIIDTGFMTKSEVDDYYNAWDDLPNARLYNEGSYFDIFKSSDALITDCGSFLAEYLPNNKPVLYLCNPNAKLNEVGQMISNTYYKCSNFADVEKYITEVIINENDYKKNMREKAMKFVKPNINGAAKAIVKYIYDSFY